jgi:hypothetical protein
MGRSGPTWVHFPEIEREEGRLETKATVKPTDRGRHQEVHVLGFDLSHPFLSWGIENPSHAVRFTFDYDDPFSNRAPLLHGPLNVLAKRRVAAKGEGGHSLCAESQIKRERSAVFFHPRLALKLARALFPHFKESRRSSVDSREFFLVNFQTCAALNLDRQTQPAPNGIKVVCLSADVIFEALGNP